MGVIAIGDNWKCVVFGKEVEVKRIVDPNENREKQKYLLNISFTGVCCVSNSI